MNEELFSQKGFIVGRVFEGTCDSDGREDDGVANVRVYLEDGRYGVTDENGRFHFEGLEPGTHTVQLDKLTLPEYLELAPCADRMGHAGRDYSQFAELRAGTLWRSDFVLRQKAAPRGRRAVRVPVRAAAGCRRRGLAAHEAVVSVSGVTAGNTRVMVMLPEGFEYVPGSATVDGAKVTDAQDQVVGAGEPVVASIDNVVVARLGELRAGHDAHVPLRDARDAARRRRAAGARRRAVRFAREVRAAHAADRIAAVARRGALRPLAVHVHAALRRAQDRAARRPTKPRCARSSTPGAARATSPSARSATPTRSRSPAATARYSPTTTRCRSARAQAVADYLAISLNVPRARVHVEGRGADEPREPGQGRREPRRQSPRRDRDRRLALRSQCAARTRDAPAASRRRIDTHGRRAARSGQRGGAQPAQVATR